MVINTLFVLCLRPLSTLTLILTTKILKNENASNFIALMDVRFLSEYTYSRQLVFNTDMVCTLSMIRTIF